jgi:electron transfer flavoprotein beta subunit
MRIIVCIKKVPDTETKIKPNGVSIDPSGVNFVINPYDEFALELALSLKDTKAAEVIVVTLGNAECEKTMRTALAMGADKAVHLKYDAATGLEDGLAVSTILAEKIKTMQADLVLFGRQAIDSDGSMMGGLVAAQLQLPFLGFVTKCDVSEKSLTASREVDSVQEVYTMPLPAVVSCNKGLNTPRYASLKGVMMAKSKPIEVVPVTSLVSQIIKLDPPTQRAQGKIIGEGKEAVQKLVALLHEEAKVI